MVIHAFDMIVSSRGGGVAILAKNSLCVSKIDFKKEFFHVEIIAIEINLGPRKVLLANIYNRPHCSELQFSEICFAIEYLFQRSNFVILSGDFNLPDIDWKTGVAPNVFFQSHMVDLFAEYGLQQRVMEPTHIKGNVLDIVLASHDNLVFDVDVLHPLNPQCDHNMIFFRSLDFQAPQSRPNKTEYRPNFSKTDFSELKTYLSNVNWPVLQYDFNAFSAQSFSELFYAIVNGGIELFTPATTDLNLSRNKGYWS